MKKLGMFLFVTMIITSALLSVGSFLGFPNDPVLSGMFWLITTLLLIVGGLSDV